MKTKSIKACAIVLAVIVIVSSAVVLSEQKDVSALVLKYGSRGETVKKLQQELKNQGFLKGSNAVDGVYGSKTRTAVRNMQKAYGLAVDGIAGPKTLSALGISGGSSSSSGGYTSSEIYLLAKCIYAEARGEPYVGKVAVGAVVLNRVKSSKFPNTISGVIYQPWAFTAVNDGQINLTPNEECKRAAQDAINGWDPTYGSLYYYNPKTATSGWIFNTTTVVQIGNHVFSV